MLCCQLIAMKIRVGSYESDWKLRDALTLYFGAALHSARNDPDFTLVPGDIPKPERNMLSKHIDYWGLHAYNIPVMIYILQQCSK
jgi:hypothetical protein